MKRARFYLNRKRILSLLLTLTLILGVAPALTFPALAADTDDVVFVKAGSAGTGSSWADAMGDVQAAIEAAAASSGAKTQVWIAAGTYTPSNRPNDIAKGDEGRQRHFSLRNGVTVIGGFAGNESTAEPKGGATILSGDFAGNDTPGNLTDNRDDNAYYVFYHPGTALLDGTAVLENVTISGGNSNYFVDYESQHRFGAGMHNDNSSPTVTDCIFTDNFAGYYGGGMYNNNSNPTVTNCDFEGNTSKYYSGGMHNTDSNPIVTGCTFTRNSTQNSVGGGMYNVNSSPIVKDCIFTENKARSGGAMYNGSDSATILIDCIFEDNEATDKGGGVFNDRCSPTVTGCTFKGNKAAGNGGGMCNNDWFCEPVISLCTFEGNEAVNGGGMYVGKKSYTAVAGCVFKGNEAGESGGGIYILSEGSVKVTSCTITGNKAVIGDGGGVFNGGSFYGGNVIISGNTAASDDELYNDGWAPFEYFIIGATMFTEDENTGIEVSGKVVNADGTLPAGSPAIGAGDKDAFSDYWRSDVWTSLKTAGKADGDYDISKIFDIAGNAMLTEDAIDIGALAYSPITYSPIDPGYVYTAPSKTIEISDVSVPAFAGNAKLITVEANVENAFSNSVEVRLVDDSGARDAFHGMLGPDAEVYPFDISLYIKGTDTRTQPKDGYKVTLTLPLPEELWDIRGEVQIAYISEGKVVALKSELKRIDGVWCIVFETDHFSPYALVVSEIPDQPDNHLCDAFTDIRIHWAFEDICYVVENGLFNGTSETLFRPDLPLNRGMIVTALWRLEGEPEASGSETFDDVKSGSFYHGPVAWASDNDIVLGYGDGRYGPDDDLTREQIAAILWRYAKYKDIDVSVGEETNILSYNDALDVSEYAIPAMQWACGAGMIQGRPGGFLDPQGTATRAEVAAMLHRFLEKQ